MMASSNPSPLGFIVSRDRQGPWRMLPWISLLAILAAMPRGFSDDLQGQYLASNARRVAQALEFLGRPLNEGMARSLDEACLKEEAESIERLLDSIILCKVNINPESKVKIEPGPAIAKLDQAAYVPFLVKVSNFGAIRSPLQVRSPQAGVSFSGVNRLSMERQQQLQFLENPADSIAPRRFLHLAIFDLPPMTKNLSGNEVEYVILLIYSSDAGTREAVLECSVGVGTQDLGFRAELPLHLEIQPAVPVRVRIADDDGTPCFARLLIQDAAGHIYPAQARRLAPDLFFQPHIYRCDGESVLLPPGDYSVEASRGPEYLVTKQTFTVRESNSAELVVRLKRWIAPMQFGYYSGDHHIHGAGCAHYDNPTQGITPRDMFRQVAGEGLNVGCVLTWGPCFEFQRQFFRPNVDQISEAKTILKYDLEISGFGSQALGHVCLLNLQDQTFPGSDGSKEKGWPTWATPVLSWAKSQGAVTGFAHSASGLEIHPQNVARRIVDRCDADHSGLLESHEVANVLLPLPFSDCDPDHDQLLSLSELELAADAASEHLPNDAIPEMNGVGAMELPVAVVHGVCDFISAMDTPRIAEWNMWYHILNCGYPLKVSGETDFPCMSGTAVGQGRSYVYLGQVERVDFAEWCRGLAAGRSYVSDGYAHAFDLTLQSDHPDHHGPASSASIGGKLELHRPAEVNVRCKVAFAPQVPESVAHGTRSVQGQRRLAGDTVTLHGSRSNRQLGRKTCLVELVINGRVIQSKEVAADGSIHDVEWNVPIQQSSWIAVRHFPQMHTNPIEVIVAEQPIRASRKSAIWCASVIEQLWMMRQDSISPSERPAAEMAFQAAIREFRSRADQSANDFTD